MSSKSLKRVEFLNTQNVKLSVIFFKIRVINEQFNVDNHNSNTKTQTSVANKWFLRVFGGGYFVISRERSVHIKLTVG